MKNLFLIVAIGLLIIFFRFPDIPAHLAFDEIEFTKIALSLQNQQYISYTTAATGHSTLYFYLILASFKLFGVTSFALRLPSAIFGVLAPIVFYAIIKQIFSKKFSFFKFQISISIALLLTLLLVTQRWYFNFARFSFEPTFLVFLELTALYFLQKHLKTNHPRDAILCGLFTGLTFHSYLPGRIFFLLPLTILLIHKQKHIILFSLTGFIVMLPLLGYLFSNPDTRVRQTVFILDKTYTLSQKTELVSQNLKKVGLMFYTQGDLNGRHNFPGKSALNPIVGVLFTFGLIFALRDYKNANNQIFIVFFLLSLIPIIVTHPSDNPSMLRSFTALPATIYFAGLSMQNLINKFKSQAAVVGIFLIIIVVVSAILDLRTYYLFQARVQKNAFEVTCPLQEVVQLNPNSLKEIPPRCRVTQDLFNL